MPRSHIPRLLWVILYFSSLISAAYPQNQVLSLDGDGDYVRLPADIFNDLNEATIEAWVKWESFDWNSPLFGFGATQQYMAVVGSQPFVSFSIADREEQGYRLTVGGALQENQWCHIAAVSGKGGMKLYLNGTLIGEHDYTGSFSSIQNGEQNYIGRTLWGADKRTGTDRRAKYLHGQIDDVRVWRVARTQAQIRAGMSRKPTGLEEDLVGSWDFESGDARDATPNSHHGQLIGDARCVVAEIPLPAALPQVTRLSGRVTDESGNPISNRVRLTRNGKPSVWVSSDYTGFYRMAVYPVDGPYDLSVTKDDTGVWHLGVSSHTGKEKTLNLILKPAISITGILLMLDDITPHVTTPVQALQNGKVIAATSSDARGRYKFVNLRPGRYQVRCMVKGGYIYHGTETMVEAEDDVPDGTTTLHVQPSKTLNTVDFRFAPFKKGRWQNYSAFHGLAGNDVHAIYQDAEGYIWFGTSGGVSRFDGETFENFTKADGLAGNQIYAIHADADGVMWFGTDGGVSRYDGQRFQNLTTGDGLAGNSVWCIHRDRSGDLWFGTGHLRTPDAGNGVSRYDGERFTNFTTADGLADNTILDIFEDKNGYIWFCTYNGASRYSDGEIVSHAAKDVPRDIGVETIHQEASGAMWFGASNGIFRSSGTEPLHLTTKDGLVDNTIKVFDVDSDGVMWFGTLHGVSQYDGKRFVNFTTVDGLPRNLIRTIYCATDGTVWFGTWAGGVSRYDENAFATFTTQDGLLSSRTSIVHQPLVDAIWLRIGEQDGGLARYDGMQNGFVNFTAKDGLLNAWLYAVYLDPDGTVWAGAQNGDVYRYDGNRFVRFFVNRRFVGDRVDAIYRDADGVMWFGDQWRGVARYDGVDLARFTTDDGLANNWVRAIHQDRDGVMWFGTEGGGISREVYPEERGNGETFVNLTEAHGLVNNRVTCIYEANDGTLWFGTDGGVSQYDRKRFVNFTTADGLAADRVGAIYQDADGVLWFATDAGLSRYDGITWTSLDTRDGIPSHKISGIHRDGAGDFWFGTDKGLMRYRPNHNTKPGVRIVSVKTDRTYTDVSALPALIVGERATIACRAIDFQTSPEKRQYQYRIREIDEAWSKPTKERTVDQIFDNPGMYHFEVRAIDRDLNYADPASFTLIVVLPWYQNGWILYPSAGGFFGLLMCSSIFAYRYYRERQRVQAYQRLAVEELADARRVQMGLMPEVAPAIDGLEIAGVCLSATDVSGDFYDYLTGEQRGEIAIVVGDVTGHGMQGAMNAVMTDGILRAIAEKTDLLSPSVLMGDLNNVLIPRMESGMNVTMVLGLINSETKTLTLANAGHHAHPLLIRDGTVEPLIAKGMPLGMMGSIRYREIEHQLQSGDVLVFMTDGIIEAKNRSGQEYQESGRLPQVIGQFTADMTAKAMVDALIDDAVTFGAEMTEEEEDDITVVVVKVH